MAYYTVVAYVRCECDFVIGRTCSGVYSDKLLFLLLYSLKDFGVFKIELHFQVDACLKPDSDLAGKVFQSSQYYEYGRDDSSVPVENISAA